MFYGQNMLSSYITASNPNSKFIAIALLHTPKDNLDFAC